MVATFLSGLVFTLIIPGILLGIVLLIVSFLMPYYLVQYKIPMQLVGLALVVFFTFQSGKQSANESYKKKELIAQVEIAELKTKSAVINETVVTRYVDRVKTIEKIKEVPIEIYVTSKANDNCRIDNADADNIRLLLNSAAKGNFPDTTSNVNGATPKP